MTPSPGCALPTRSVTANSPGGPRGPGEIVIRRTPYPLACNQSPPARSVQRAGMLVWRPYSDAGETPRPGQSRRGRPFGGAAHLGVQPASCLLTRTRILGGRPPLSHFSKGSWCRETQEFWATRLPWFRTLCGGSAQGQVPGGSGVTAHRLAPTPVEVCRDGAVPDRPGSPASGVLSRQCRGQQAGPEHQGAISQSTSE